MANNCSVCKKSVGKYKCPSCYLPYCSVKCCEHHKKSQCVPLPKIASDEEPNANSSQFVTPDTVSQDKLQLLDNDKDLKITLDNPHVRHIIESIDKSADPQKLLEEAMLEPIFVEFVEQCLKIVEPQNSNDF